MINITQQQLINLWAELEDAYNGVNGFGSFVAEIYAYTLQSHYPGYDLGKDEEFELNTAKTLYNILTVFQKKRNCTIYLDCDPIKIKRKLGKWLLKYRFVHRVHIEILKK